MNRKKTIWIMAVLLAAGTTLFLTACKKKQPPVSFKELLVAKDTISITILSNGSVEPENRVEVAPPVAGRVEKILVKEGDLVKQGQVLGTVSSSERAALLDAARAKGPRELAHWEKLYKTTPFLAPMTGQVIARNMEPGQTVGASESILVLSDHLIVTAQVDETDIGKIKAGQAATLTLDAYPDQPFSGKVLRIGYEAATVNNVTIYKVYVVPDQVPSFMRSGMTADVSFLIDQRKDVLVLSTEAIKERDGKSVVLVPSAGPRPEQQEIETGLTDGAKTEVVSGLSEGATVLVAQFNASSSKAVSGTNPFMPTRPGSKKTSNKTSQSEGGPPPP